MQTLIFARNSLLWRIFPLPSRQTKPNKLRGERICLQNGWAAQTVRLSNPVSVVSYASIGGKLEAQGPLAGYFDELSTDSFFGCKTWEKGDGRHAAPRA